MNWMQALGTALSVGGAVGYLVGVSVTFPGRAFSLTAVMVGLTLFAIGAGADA